MPCPHFDLKIIQRSKRQSAVASAACQSGERLFPELVNPVFTANGDNVKVSVAVKFIDNQTKATQVSQYELTLHKDSNWKM